MKIVHPYWGHKTFVSDESHISLRNFIKGLKLLSSNIVIKYNIVVNYVVSVEFSLSVSVLLWYIE